MAPGSSIIVGVRVRPFNQRELKYKSTNIVEMTGNTTSLVSQRNNKSSGEKPREFPFDYAFWTHSKDDPRDDRPFADQELVFKALGGPLLDNCLEGFNACLFCYGQTGSGKTYSMMGTPSDPGILPRLISGLFEEIGERSKNSVAVKVECSFAEIYNEVVQDLLSAKGPVSGGLKVRQDPKKGIFVQGLTHVATSDAEQFEGVLNKALSNRATAATNMNAVSSRSHAIIMIKVVQIEANTSCTRTSMMSMVDLAGSERAESTGATGATMTEAQNINYSLSVLGMCLTRLADQAEAKSNASKLHVPFRDSQLTWLLSDNLGGNSKTSMIAAISPADVNYEETLSTLRFASVTKRVKTVAIVNESANDKLIRELKEELAELQGTLMKMKKDGPSTQSIATAAPPGLEPGDDPLAEDLEDNSNTVSNDELQTEVSAADLLSPERGDANSNNNNNQANNNNNAGVEDEDVDWKAPQFLNLSPSSSNNNNKKKQTTESSLTSPGGSRLNKEPKNFSKQSTAIQEGENSFHLGTALVSIEFSGLTGEVTMKVTDVKSMINDEDQVLVNGEPLLLNHGMQLKQNDRIICGESVLRFSHYQAILDAEGKSFRTEPDSDRHCGLLESYFRTTIQKEQIDEFMELLTAGLAEGCPPQLHSAIADALQTVEAEQQTLQSALFSKECALSEEFPQLDKVEGLDVNFDTKAFEQARAKKEAEIQQRNAQLQSLKDKMAKAAEDAEQDDIDNRVFAKTSREAALKEAQRLIESAEQEVASMSDAARAEELALQEQLDEAASERILAVELAYHKEVRKMRQFRKEPIDAEDKKIFTRLSTILQNDARLNIQRCSEQVFICDTLVSTTLFEPRTVCLSKRFMFVFKKLYRREPLVFSIYIPGATTSAITTEKQGTGKAATTRYVVDLTAACARSPAPEHQANPPMIRLGFADAKEARAWKTWIDTHATPVPPLSIWKRLLETEISERRKHVEEATSEKTVSSFDLGQRENEPGKPFEIKGWVADDSTTNCTRCNTKFGFFTRKHHCRLCGEIFCSNCLDGKKVCIPCQSIVAASGKKEEEIIAQLNKPSRNASERHRIILKEPVFNFIEQGKYFAFYCRGAMKQFATRRDLDDFAVSLAASEEESNAASGIPNLQLSNTKPYLLDLFRGRFHEWCSVDISHVWRCSYHPLAVNIRLRPEYVMAKEGLDYLPTDENDRRNNDNDDGNNNNSNSDDDANEASVYSTQPVEDKRPRLFASIICTSVVDRERLFEGIAMMIGRRGYSPIGQCGHGSNELDVLVVAPAEMHSANRELSNSSITALSENLSLTDAQVGLIRSCALKLTNTLRTQLRVRVSHQIEGAKFHFQQGDFDIIAAVSLNTRPPWDKQYLRTAGMVELCAPIQLSPANSLFVCADEYVAQHVTPPVSANARGICILAFGVHESNILVVASTANDIADFEEVTEEETSRLLQDEVDLAEAESSHASKPGNNSRNELDKSDTNFTSRSNNTSTNVSPRKAHYNDPNHNNSNNNANDSSPGGVSNIAQLGSPLNHTTDLSSPDSTTHLPRPNDQKAVLFASALPLERLIMWPIRDVDPVEQFENVFVIGHDTQLSGFSSKDKCGIQFKGQGEGQVVVQSKGHVECSLHVAQHILTSLRMKNDDDSSSNNNNNNDNNESSLKSLPAHINVKIARFFDTFDVEVHGNHDASTTVIVNTPYEKCSQQEISESDELSMSFDSSYKLKKESLQGGLGALASSSSTNEKKVGNTIRLLDRVAEHCSAKSLFVKLHDFGTITVPFHQFMNQAVGQGSRKSVFISGCSVMYCGIQVGKADLAISMF